MERQPILVTGSRGLIGSALVAVLSAHGHPVRRFDIAEERGARGDIRSRRDLDAAIDGCGGIVHLAAVSRVIWGEHDPGLCRHTNILGTHQVTDAALAARTRPWLIFASSREVYGQSPHLPVSENAPLMPMNHYARSKLAAEGIVRQARQDGLRTAILRFSTVYGATGDHADRVIPAFCRSAILGLPLRVDGAETTVDITHVSDVARAIAGVGAMLSRGEALPPLHLVSGTGTRLSDLARLVVRLAASTSPITTVAARGYDVSRFVGDPARTRARIGWQPQVDMESGLTALIAAFRHDLADVGSVLT